MRFSLQIHYAICGVFDLAYNGQGEPVQVRMVGERQEIPTRYLEQIFQRLRRAKLVSGKRGPGGGYTLSRAPSDISLLDIVEAVEGPVGGTRAPQAGAGRPSGRSGAAGGVASSPDFLWPELAQCFAEVLEDRTVEDLCREAAQRGIRRANLVAHTYEI